MTLHDISTRRVPHLRRRADPLAAAAAVDQAAHPAARPHGEAVHGAQGPGHAAARGHRAVVAAARVSSRLFRREAACCCRGASSEDTRRVSWRLFRGEAASLLRRDTRGASLLPGRAARAAGAAKRSLAPRRVPLCPRSSSPDAPLARRAANSSPLAARRSVRTFERFPSGSLVTIITTVTLRVTVTRAAVARDAAPRTTTARTRTRTAATATRSRPRVDVDDADGGARAPRRAAPRRFVRGVRRGPGGGDARVARRRRAAATTSRRGSRVRSSGGCARPAAHGGTARTALCVSWGTWAWTTHRQRAAGVGRRGAPGGGAHERTKPPARSPARCKAKGGALWRSFAVVSCARGVACSRSGQH